jgi:carboxypeptidase C (cathepsin A)
MFREFDQLPWSQDGVFRRQPKTDWLWTDSDGFLVKGGKIKGVPKLQVASVYNAGHMSPGDAKPAVASLVREWISR